MIKIENITVQYQLEIPFRELSFDIRGGEKVTLTGPSGCGKSTLLNAILGFIPLSSGNIEVDGIALNVSGYSDIRQRIAWLPQELNMELDTVKNLVYYPFSFKGNKKYMPSENTVFQLFNKLLLDDGIFYKPLAEISGGQKQRVVLASLLLLNRPVLLLDEPTSALDDEATETLCQYLLSLKETTILSASHDKRWIDRMDRNIKIGSNGNGKY